MSDIERFKKHNKKQSSNDGPKTKDVDFEHLVPNGEVSLDDETRELLFDDLVDPATKHQRYLEEQNLSEKKSRTFASLFSIIVGITSVLGVAFIIWQHFFG